MDNLFSQIAICSLELDNSREWITIPEKGLSNLRKWVAIWENRLSYSRERIAIRENGLSNSRERIAIRENELSNSRERITNPWERIAQFDITIYLWFFGNISMSLQSFRSFAPNSCSHWVVSLRYFKIMIEGRDFSYFIVFFSCLGYCIHTHWKKWYHVIKCIHATWMSSCC